MGKLLAKQVKRGGYNARPAYENRKEKVKMNAIEEIKKSLYESYKWLYEEAMNDASRHLQTATNLRKAGNPTSAVFWLNYAGKRRRDALRHKRSMKSFAS